MKAGFDHIADFVMPCDVSGAGKEHHLFIKRFLSQVTKMIKFDSLKNHPHAIPALANIWHEGLGKIWMPEIGIEEIESLYYEELKRGMPITYFAHYVMVHPNQFVS
ncbi:hypothetical protein SCJ08_12565 [Legionella pneumophila serogroup 1]